MSHYILVQTTGSAHDAAVFDLALQVARRDASAHLEFLHVSPDARDMIAAMSPGLMGDGYEIQRIADEFDQAAQERARKAEDSVQAFCVQNQVPITGDTGATGITATFRRVSGVETNILPRHGRVADLTVAGRSKTGADQLDLLGTLLLDTGRPLLLSPAAPAPLAASLTVAIAWKDTPQAARAVAAAHGFIAAAEHVVVLTVDEEDAGDEAASARLAQVLAWQAKKVSTVHVPSDGQAPGDALLAAAATAGAGLLVMGGYGHARLREAVIGGVTRRVLTQADIPVLLAH